jgi:hypothetical protein
MNNKLKIFNNNINNKYKLIPFNLKSTDYRERYEAPVSKEWKNTAYFYDKNNLKNIPSNDINLNKMIKSYFNLHLKNKFIHLRAMSTKRKRSLLKRIYVSNVEIKHTNNKAIITLYVLNTKKKILYKKYLKSKRIFESLRFYILKIQRNFLKKNISVLKDRLIKSFLGNKFILLKTKVEEFKLELLKKIINYSNLSFNRHIKKNIFNKFKFVRKIIVLRRHIYEYKINTFKFEEVYFLPKLNNLLVKILNKKIEFNIVNLKSLVFNTDIFTKALALKLGKKRFNVMRGINSIINRAKLPKVNTIKERASLNITKNINLVHNKYKDSHLLSNLNSNEDFFMFLKNMFNIHNKYLRSHTLKLTSIGSTNPSYTLIGINNSNTEREKIIRRSIFDSINHKNMGGIRLEIRGRLTRRNRADRAVYKLKWKGGLKNIESSFNKLSSVLYRGHFKPNVTYSVINSKRRVGAFAVKGWMSSK